MPADTAGMLRPFRLFADLAVTVTLWLAARPIALVTRVVSGSAPPARRRVDGRDDGVFPVRLSRVQLVTSIGALALIGILTWSLGYPLRTKLIVSGLMAFVITALVVAWRHDQVAPRSIRITDAHVEVPGPLRDDPVVVIPYEHLTWKQVGTARAPAIELGIRGGASYRFGGWWLEPGAVEIIAEQIEARRVA